MSIRKHRLAQAKARSANFLFMLHCDGVSLNEIQKKCFNKVLVPMPVLNSIEELHEALKSVDWRVSFAKVPIENSDKTHNAAFGQCPDCWIEFYREMVKDEADKEAWFAKIDSEGKFLDRLRGNLTSSAEPAKM